MIFVHHLALGHYEEAYVALIANPDPLRKEDNLRDLVKTLLDKKLLDTLLSFPYVNMDDLFTSIVMARARACDSVHNMFYDFLFSFEVKRANMRNGKCTLCANHKSLVKLPKAFCILSEFL